MKQLITSRHVLGQIILNGFLVYNNKIHKINDFYIQALLEFHFSLIDNNKYLKLGFWKFIHALNFLRQLSMEHLLNLIKRNLICILTIIIP